MFKKKTLLILTFILLILVGTFFAWKLYHHQTDDLLSQLEEGEAPRERLDEATLTFLWDGQAPQGTQGTLDQVERKLKNSLNIRLKFIFSKTPAWDVSFYRDDVHSHMDFKALVSHGLKDITEEFQRLAPHYYRSLSPEELRPVTVDGKIYAIPQHFFTIQTCSAIVREDLMAKYQIPQIKDFDDYEKYLRTIKAKEPGLFPVVFNENSLGSFAEANGYVILNNQLGLVYSFNDPDPKILAWEQTPAFRKEIDTLLRWYNNGYLLKSMGAAEIDDQMVASGKWASFIAPFGSELRYNAILKSQNISWKYKAYPLNSSYSFARHRSTSMLMINPQSKNIARIFMFINWLYAKQENYVSLMLTLQENPYTWVWYEAFRNIDFERFKVLSSANSQKEHLEFLKNNTKYPLYMGFNPDLGPVQRIATLRQVSNGSLEKSIYHGIFSPAEVEKYIREQKQAGVDQLVVEVQRQLEQWKADK